MSNPKKHKGSKQKNSTKKEGLQFIKDAIESKNISRSEVEMMADIDYPLFSFRYFNDISAKDCKDHKFFLSFINRLKKLSNLGWSNIRTSHTHSYGMESMSKEEIRHNGLLPDFITKDVDLHIFRAVGDNRVMVGLQKGKIFHIFFIESKFGDISHH
ncbi:MAG: hypothetical protein IJE76_01475 [Bacteroidales bacterium]|nr:hypothetical protein [Bacteroidales bacterium]